MKQILATLNNDFFFMVKEWLESVNNIMKISQKGKIEIKYLNGKHYLTYPLDCTVDVAKEDIEHVKYISIIHVEDGNVYVGRKYNDLLADSYEFQMDSYIKGVL